MTSSLDDSVYPDRPPPGEPLTESEKADYLHRMVSAFDFGVVPDEPALALLGQWKFIFDRYPLNASPAYHGLRTLFGWEPVERRPYLDDPTYVKFDRIEGREDGFEDAV